MNFTDPKLIRDMYWDDEEPILPYTKASASTFRAMGASRPHIGSAMNLEINPDDTEFLPMETIMEEENFDNVYNSAPGSAGGDTIINSNGFILTKDKDAESVQNNKEEVESNRGLRLFPESFRDSLRGSFRGSRIFNMILGQSNENVNKEKESHPLDHSQGNRESSKPVNVPFILRTPKKRTRTTSVGDGNRPTLHPAATVTNLPGSNRTSKINMNGGDGYGEVPTAPIILGSHQSQASRKGTPLLDRKPVHSLQDAHDNSFVNRLPGVDGFRFPSSYLPSHSQSQQGYYQDIPLDTNNLINDTSSDRGVLSNSDQTRIRSGPEFMMSTDRMNNMSRASSIRSYAPSEPVILTIGTPSTPSVLGSSEPQVMNESDLYEPDLNPEEVNMGESGRNNSSLPTPGTDGSDDSDSNQNTVRSFSELIKQSQITATNNTKKDEND